jgi:hypothetical protein
MSKQLSIFAPIGYTDGYCTILPADTTTWKGVLQVSTDDANLIVFSAVSDDSAVVNLRLGINVGGTLSGNTISGGATYQIGTVNLPITAGTVSHLTAPAVDLLGSLGMPQCAIDRNSKRYLPMVGGTILCVAALATVNTNKTVTVMAKTEKY